MLMKKLILKIVQCLAIYFISIYTHAQDTISVEKSTFGIQTGILGIWVHNEMRLTNQIALRTELGFDTVVFKGNFYPKAGYLITPVITLEPRWYYNLRKRKKVSKNISGNSGNFVTLQTSFHPNWFVVSNYNNIKIVNQISIVPTWGIKRNIGSHFTYETGIGLGYRYYYAKSEGYTKDEKSASINLHLRLGYRF